MADVDDILAQYEEPSYTTADILARMPYEGAGNVYDLKAYLRDRAMRTGRPLSSEANAAVERTPKREPGWADWLMSQVPESAMFAANFVGPKVRHSGAKVGPNAGRRLTAGLTPTTERAAALERGRQGLAEPGPYLERGHRNSPLGTSMNPGGHKYFADFALREARGDYDKALALLKANPEAANVLRYWKEAGYSFRSYENPERSQSYWRALDEFNHAHAPPRLLEYGMASPVAASILSQYLQDDPSPRASGGSVKQAETYGAGGTPTLDAAAIRDSYTDHDLGYGRQPIDPDYEDWRRRAIDERYAHDLGSVEVMQAMHAVAGYRPGKRMSTNSADLRSASEGQLAMLNGLYDLIERRSGDGPSYAENYGPLPGPALEDAPQSTADVLDYLSRFYGR